MLSGQNLRLLCQWDWFAQVLTRSLLGQMLLNLFDWFDQIPKWYQKAQKLLCQWDLFALVLKLSLQSQVLLNLLDQSIQIPRWFQQGVIEAVGSVDSDTKVVPAGSEVTVSVDPVRSDDVVVWPESEMTWLSGQNLSLLCLWELFAQFQTWSLLGQMLLNLFDRFDQIPKWYQKAQKLLYDMVVWPESELLCLWDWFAQVLRRSLLGQMLLNLFDWFDQIPKWYQQAQK
ncbi:hypothetical protein NQZ68_038137 [Dissostichus eleginoides]|nr:hypothetical protein NQZ68_038137 [Dissostichus eleginoides]